MKKEYNCIQVSAWLYKSNVTKLHIKQPIMFYGRFKHRVFFMLLHCIIISIHGQKQAQREVMLSFTQEMEVTEKGDTSSSHEMRDRRSVTRIPGKCHSQKHCHKNTTSFKADTFFNCYCDDACYKIFSDCCPDYEKQCGEQKVGENVEKNPWQCVELGNYVTGCKIVGATGVWMVAKCPRNWTLGEGRAKCEKPKHKKVIDSTPVLGNNKITYRNMHCAVCHGVTNYSTWNIPVFTFVTPPEWLDLDSKLEFIVQNGGYIFTQEPREGQPRRYCAGRNYISNCTNTTHVDRSNCLNGGINAVMGKWKRYYKNEACASCNGQPGLTTWLVENICGYLPEGFSLVFNLREPGGKPRTSVVTTFCPYGTVFDTNLQFCRKGYIVTPDDKLSNQFLVVLWFQKSSIKTNLNSTLANNLKSALLGNFSLSADEISALAFHKQDLLGNYIVATFRFILSPLHSLIFANQQKNNYNITRENAMFLTLLNSTAEILSIAWKDTTFSIIKLMAKQLSCYDGKIFHPNEYRIDSEKLVLNKTGEVYLLSDYSLLKGDEGNLTLCRKLILSDCMRGAYVPLQEDEYVIFPNLSVYHKTTNSTFRFGGYSITETLNQGQGDISNATERNWTIALCLPFQNAFNKTEIEYITQSYSLRLVTLVGFSVSITCHILILITYSLFQELRTVPGLNLMSLSLSMCLAQIVWLISSTHFLRTSHCKRLAVLDHYLHQVSFLAMTAISYHTHHTFSQPFKGRIANRSRSKFIKYSIFVWVSPAVFVAICVTLDKTETFQVNYGVRCWLGTRNAKLFLFLLPLAITLLYNICKFIQTAVRLSHHDKDRQNIRRNNDKKNVIICGKLATLVGFPWLFLFMGVLFPVVEALNSMFVLGVCLQGVLIALVFLFNKNILKHYKDWWNTKRMIDIGSKRNGTAISPAINATI